MVGIALALAGCSPSPEPPVAKRPAANRPPGDSPEAVGGAWIDAMDRRDFAAAVACVAPETVKQLSTRKAWGLLDLRDNVERRYAKDGTGYREDAPWTRGRANWLRSRSFARIDPVLIQHGLTRGGSRTLTVGRSRDEAEAELSRRIRDHAAFLVDYLNATREDLPEWRKGANWPKPVLAKVAIRGDEAEGRLTYRSSHPERGNDPPEVDALVRFVKLPVVGWRVGDHGLNWPFGFAPIKDRVEDMKEPLLDAPVKNPRPKDAG